MAISLDVEQEQFLNPKVMVMGIGGAGGNAINNMIGLGLQGVSFIIANTDIQALKNSSCEDKIILGAKLTKGLGAGSRPEIGKASAEESTNEIISRIEGYNMIFITAGMGGGTGTGAAPVIAKIARELGILTVGVVTKPFDFEGTWRIQLAESGVEEMAKYVDTLIVIPNQNLFYKANEKTTFAEAFKMVDDVLYSGIKSITDLMIMPGLINLDFADIKSIMSNMGKAVIGSGEASGENRALEAAQEAISNPLLDNVTMRGAKGVLINISGSTDITLYEVDTAAQRIKDEVDANANIIFGSTFDETLESKMRVSVIATGVNNNRNYSEDTLENLNRLNQQNNKLRNKQYNKQRKSFKSPLISQNNNNSNNSNYADSEDEIDIEEFVKDEFNMPDPHIISQSGANQNKSIYSKAARNGDNRSNLKNKYNQYNNKDRKQNINYPELNIGISSKQNSSDNPDNHKSVKQNSQQEDNRTPVNSNISNINSNKNRNISTYDDPSRDIGEINQLENYQDSDNDSEDYNDANNISNWNNNRNITRGNNHKMRNDDHHNKNHHTDRTADQESSYDNIGRKTISSKTIKNSKISNNNNINTNSKLAAKTKKFSLSKLFGFGKKDDSFKDSFQQEPNCDTKQDSRNRIIISEDILNTPSYIRNKKKPEN